MQGARRAVGSAAGQSTGKSAAHTPPRLPKLHAWLLSNNTSSGPRPTAPAHLDSCRGCDVGPPSSVFQPGRHPGLLQDERTLLSPPALSFLSSGLCPSLCLKSFLRLFPQLSPSHPQSLPMSPLKCHSLSPAGEPPIALSTICTCLAYLFVPVALPCSLRTPSGGTVSSLLTLPSSVLVTTIPSGRPKRHDSAPEGLTGEELEPCTGGPGLLRRSSHPSSSERSPRCGPVARVLCSDSWMKFTCFPVMCLLNAFLKLERGPHLCLQVLLLRM